MMLESIECSCSIEYDSFDGYNEFSRETTPIARKTHECCECGEIIQPGTKYEYAVGKFEGAMWSYKTCMVCRQIRNDHCCSWQYGELCDVLWEVLGLNYITGEIDSRFNEAAKENPK